MRLWIVFIALLLFICSSVTDATCFSATDTVVDRVDAMPQVQVESRSDVVDRLAAFDVDSFAELGGVLTSSSFSSFFRLHRYHYSEKYCALQSMLRSLSSRLFDLCVSRLNISSFSIFYCCHPVCQYYIFTLKRILI